MGRLDLDDVKEAFSDQADPESREKAALGALREAELQYRVVADFTYDWEYWESPDGTLRYVSPSCERITGYTPQQFLANPDLLVELILTEDRKAWLQHRRHAESCKPGEVEFRIRRKDGEIRWIEHACQPVSDPEGVFLGYRGSNRDITRRKRAEEELHSHRAHLEQIVSERSSALAQANAALVDEIAERQRTERELRRSEERYTLAQRAAKIGSWDWDIQTGDLHWSDQIEPIFGFKQGEFGATYQAFLDCVHPQDRQHVVDAVNACVRDGADYAIEHRIVWPDGTVRWVSEVGDVVRDESGQAIRMLGIVRDITERIQAQETHARMAAIIASSDDAIISKALDGTILSWNVGAQKTYGYTAEEVLGRHISILSPPSHRDEIAGILERLKQGEHVAHFETKRIRKDGSRIQVSLNTSPIKDTTGRVIGASTIARDITKRKQVEQALQAAKEAAEVARREEAKRRQEAERRRQIAESLGDVISVLNSNRPLQEVLDYIAVRASQLLDTRAVGIYSMESETGALSVQATRGLLITYVAGVEIPIGQGALREAMVTRRPVVVPDLVSDPGSPAGQAQHQAGIDPWARVYQALLAVPIVVQGEIYGGMLLYYAQPRTLSEEEIELAVAFGAQVALAIENARLRDQVEQAATTAERDRLARELHDAVTQTLFSASLIAEALPRVWEQNPEEGRRGLQELRRLTRGAAAEMRTMLVELRPAALTEKPLGELIRHLTEAMTSRTQVPIDLTIEGNCLLSPDVQIALYRIAQEALNNVAKYSRASQTSVQVYCDPTQAELRIRDNGCGFDPADILPDQFGVKIMHERVDAIGARLQIDSQPGHGTEVVVRWPDR
jgi:two-component system nitrate/nitrite sensor histidine kinase NarX